MRPMIGRIFQSFRLGYFVHDISVLGVFIQLWIISGCVEDWKLWPAHASISIYFSKSETIDYHKHMKPSKHFFPKIFGRFFVV